MKMSKLRELLGLPPESKRLLAAVLAGCGLVLLASAKLWGAQQTRQVQSKAEAGSAEEYRSALQGRLEALLAEVEGVGRVRVLVTLEEGVSHSYATEQKTQSDATHSYSGEKPLKLSEKETAQQSYVLVGGGSEKQPLLLSSREPTVRGVVVVCEGAKRPVVCERITQIVCTALRVGAGAVTIAQHK